ncbi:hypothetical protein ACFLV2_00180 [Chloroflexota bacterium]
MAIFAIIGAIFAIANLWAIKRKYRYEILVSLTDQINNSNERQNRAIIHNAWARANWENDDEVGEKIFSLFKELWDAETNRTRIIEEKRILKNAIEETVACLNKIGYFLMERDKALQKETPIQIWSIADDMWIKLGAFVEKRHGDRGEVWAFYFKKLGLEARHKMDEWKRNN